MRALVVQRLVDTRFGQPGRGYPLPPRLEEVSTGAFRRRVITDFVSGQPQEIWLTRVSELKMTSGPVGEAAQPGQGGHVNTGIEARADQQIKITEFETGRRWDTVISAPRICGAMMIRHFNGIAPLGAG